MTTPKQREFAMRLHRCVLEIEKDADRVGVHFSIFGSIAGMVIGSFLEEGYSHEEIETLLIDEIRLLLNTITPENLERFVQSSHK